VSQTLIHLVVNHITSLLSHSFKHSDFFRNNTVLLFVTWS